MTYYKIRHKETGLFLKGTPSYYSYDKTGRIFQTLGRLRAFITGIITGHRYRPTLNFSDLEILELEMIVKDTKQVIDVVDPKKLIAILNQ